MESLSSNVELDSGAFPISVQLFEHANQIVACLITRVAHWRIVACVDADWFSCWVTYLGEMHNHVPSGRPLATPKKD